MSRSRKVSRGFQVVQVQTGRALSEVFKTRKAARDFAAKLPPGAYAGVKQLEDHISEEEYQEKHARKSSPKSKSKTSSVSDVGRFVAANRKRRPRKHFAFGARARSAAKHVTEGAGLKSYRLTKIGNQNPRQFVIPGAEPRVYAHAGRPLPARRVISLSPTSGSRSAAPKPAKPSKLTIREILASGKTLRLKPAPYSDTNLSDGNFLNLQPHKGGWIVSHRGVWLGSIKKKKAGWDLSGTKGMNSTGGYGEGAAKVKEATELLDEYYAAGGK